MNFRLTHLVLGLVVFCLLGVHTANAQSFNARESIKQSLLELVEVLVQFRDRVAATEPTSEIVFDQTLGSSQVAASAQSQVNTFTANGLTIQQGKTIVFDIDDCEFLNDCFGNNANSPYLLFALPPHPNRSQTPDSLVGNVPGVPAGMSINYWLNKNEGLVVVGITPPELAYFGLTPYVYSRVDNSGSPQAIFASTGDSLNHRNLRTANGQPFNSWFATIYASDKKVINAAKLTLKQSGLNDAAINVVPLSRSQIKFGLDAKKSDTFSVVGRMALPTSQSAFNNFAKNPQIWAYRLTSQTGAGASVTVPPRMQKGDGVTEDKYKSGLDSLENALIASIRSTGVKSRNIKSVYIADPEFISGYIDPDECIANVTECLGDNGDTTYAAGPLQALTVTPLTLDGNDSIYAIGVNHEHVGKAEYSAISLYLADTRTGIAGVSSRQMKGSASPYLSKNFNRYFVWEFTRNCNGRSYCTEVGYGFPGASNTDKLNFIFRAYINPGTSISAAPEEMLGERVIWVKR